MKTFVEFLEGRGPDEPSLPSDPSADIFSSDNIREKLVATRNLISNFEPRDVEDTKDLLISLKEVVEDKLSGA